MLRPSGLDLKYQDLSTEARIREMERDEVLYQLEQQIKLANAKNSKVYYNDIDSLLDTDFDDNDVDKVEQYHSYLYDIRKQELKYKQIIDSDTSIWSYIEFVLFTIILAFLNIPVKIINPILGFALAIIGVPILAKGFYAIRKTQAQTKLNAIHNTEKYYKSKIKELQKNK